MKSVKQAAPLLSVAVAFLFAPFGGAESLPFDREVINRYSLDGLPRSLSVCQGKDVWLGYDLERGTLCKVWKAVAGRPGLVAAGFTRQSAGKAWFEDRSDASWELLREGRAVPLSVRYLGCSQRESEIELSWELRHAGGAVRLLERIPISAPRAGERVSREWRADALADDEVLLPPRPVREAWRLTPATGETSALTLTGSRWHRLTLP